MEEPFEEIDEIVDPDSSFQQAEYPRLLDRIQSTMIDTLFMIFLMFLATPILEKFPNAPDWVRMVAFFGIWFVYEPLCTSLGFTLGNYIKNLRVRKHSDITKRINIFQAIIRYIFKLGLGWISLLTVTSNREKRAIHDMVAGSIVIKV